MFRKGKQNEPDRPARRDSNSSLTHNIAGLQSVSEAYLRANFPGAVQGTSARVGPLPTRESADPIRGWKTYYLQLLNGKWVFVGGGGRWTVSVEETAGCQKLHVSDTHKPPALDCSCGFYAWKDRPDTTTAPLIEVDLCGRVIVCEKGYRAEHQSVLCVHFPDWCVICGAQARTLVRDVREFGFTQHPATLLSVCALHAQYGYEIPLDVLANSLGTEVRFG